MFVWCFTVQCDGAEVLCLQCYKQCDQCKLLGLKEAKYASVQTLRNITDTIFIYLQKVVSDRFSP